MSANAFGDMLRDFPKPSPDGGQAYQSDVSDWFWKHTDTLRAALAVADAADKWEASRLSQVDPSRIEYGDALMTHREHREALKAAVVKLREAASQAWIDSIQPIEEL